MQGPLHHDCDVIIVNYNAGRLLGDCVASALAAGATRAIVVDNASRDNSLDHLTSRFGHSPQLLVLRNERNLGFAAACNQGAQASQTAFMLFLNPDSVIAPQALGRMIQVAEGLPRAGMIGGFLCNPDGSEQAGGRRVFPTPRRAFMRAFGLSRFGRRFPVRLNDFLLHTEALPPEPVTVEAISGACMMVKREAFEDVGPWDEAYFLHCEDLDWCMRFKLKGWQVVFVPDASVTHVRGACSRNRPVFVEWHKHHGMLRFYRKFFRHKYPGLLWWLVVVGVWFRFTLVSSYRAGQALGSRLGNRRHG